jgi:hypothetical protein
VAVRTVVWAQCARQCAAVRLVGYGTARGIARQCGSVQQCAAVRVAVSTLCAAVCSSERQCVAVREAVCGQCAR